MPSPSGSDPDYDQLEEVDLDASEEFVLPPENVLSSLRLPSASASDGDSLHANDISSNTGSSGAGLPHANNNNGEGTRPRRGRGKTAKRIKTEDNEMSSSEEDSRRRQEKSDRRRELMQKHMEEVKWQAVDKILNEKGRKEREKEKLRRRQLEDSRIRQAAEEARKLRGFTSIRIKYCKDGTIRLSFPEGLLLPAVLMQEKGMITAAAATLQMEQPHENKQAIRSTLCMKCGRPSKYCNPKSRKLSCSLECYKALN